MVRHDQGAFIRVPVGARGGRRRREGRLIRRRSMTCAHYRRQSDRESLRAGESAADLGCDAANKEAPDLVDRSTSASSAAVCRNSKYGLELSYLIYQIRNIKLEPIAWVSWSQHGVQRRKNMRICTYAADAVGGYSETILSQAEAHAAPGPQIREGCPQ